MPLLNLQDIYGYVETNIDVFHNKRLKSLKKLSLDKVLKRKNPYLFKAKNILTAQEIVKTILDAYLSSQEETIFGEFLEKLSIFINKQVYNGQKSSAEGIDLEFEKEEIKYIVSIKSGPNWGNSSQIKKMQDNFRKAKRILGTNRSKVNIVAINGCCYGRDNKPEKGEYLKLCGERFWYFISGNKHLYKDIITPLGYRAKQKNECFMLNYANLVNRFTIGFGKYFCNETGAIDWEKLVVFNAAEKAPNNPF